MEEQFTFAIRVCAFCAAFLVTATLARELYQKVHDHTHGAVFWLVLSFALIAVGLTMMTGWTIAYSYTRITGLPAEWMFESPVVPSYTVFMVASAILLLRSLSLTPYKGWAAAGIIVASGVTAYFWIGAYL